MALFQLFFSAIMANWVYLSAFVTSTVNILPVDLYYMPCAI
jgi:hypothetical protein